MKNNITTLRVTPRFPNALEPDFLSRRVDHYYRERVNNTWHGGHIMRGQTPSIDAIHLSSNDYLAIAKHPEIINAAANTIIAEGSGTLMSGIFYTATILNFNSNDGSPTLCTLKVACYANLVGAPTQV